ncbi:MAG: sigma-70 family RNA polymerase sigma factor [Rhodothermales bacterium]
MAGNDVTTRVTQLLDALRQGDDGALNQLFPLVYDHLHEMAHGQRRHWQGDNTLNTTALVHEAYLKMMGGPAAEWNNRAHFYGVAAIAMRHILINYAKKRQRKKRGGDQIKLSLQEERLVASGMMDLSPEHADDLVLLDEAMKRLETLSPRQVRIVECRFFGGMSIAETSEALQLSPATVKRGWAMAQAWLFRAMTENA